MSRKIALLLPIAFILAAAFGYAQYTGFDIERAEPPSLLPQAGPGDRAILEELKRTNALLEQNNQLVQEQNRMIRELVARQKE